jgi:hypothetical protein
MGRSTLVNGRVAYWDQIKEKEIETMTRDEMNTFLYLVISNQQDDSEHAYQPRVRSNEDDDRVSLIAIISLIAVVLLPFLVMTV